jgi:hypothetical protein
MQESRESSVRALGRLAHHHAHLAPRLHSRSIFEPVSGSGIFTVASTVAAAAAAVAITTVVARMSSTADRAKARMLSNTSTHPAAASHQPAARFESSICPGLSTRLLKRSKRCPL